MRIIGQILGLLRIIVGEEAKPRRVVRLEQNDSVGNLSLRIAGGEGHGVQLKSAFNFHLLNLFKPIAKLVKGIILEIGLIQSVFGVLPAKIFQIHVLVRCKGDGWI